MASGRVSQNNVSPKKSWFYEMNNRLEHRTAGSDKMHKSRSGRSPWREEPCSARESPPHYPPSISSFAQPTVTPGYGSSVTSTSYRCVIDDLTVENQRLQRELRKYKALERQGRKANKVFEIQIHEIATEQKRELLERLADFAATIDGVGGLQLKPVEPSTINVAGTSFHSSSETRTTGALQNDSAYASISTVGPKSASTHDLDAYDDKTGLDRRRDSLESISDVDKVPAGLIAPKKLARLTERGKQKYVVRRLEQLFAGKDDNKSKAHSQPMQQQEISNSAAEADRVAAGGVSRTEGIREARILELPIESDLTTSNSPSLFARTESTESDPSSADDASDGPDQRPTRPLDLDPERAQIPSDNIDYIRHLGLATPKFSHEESNPNPDAEGWMFLNLLMSMAQLHILNVTPDFVRTAVASVSEKFQLSEDGQKIRWIGSTGTTRLSSSTSGNSSDRTASPQDSDTQDERAGKRRKVSVTVAGRFPYKPIFHRVASVADSSDGSEFRYTGRGRSSVQSSISSDVSRFKSRGGAITFYRGAQFFSDLTGDRTGIESPPRSNDRDVLESNTSNSTSSSRAFSAAVDFVPSSHFSRPSITAETEGPEISTDTVDCPELDVPMANSLTAEQSEEPPLTFNASGLGGTQTADHFLWSVRTRRTVLPEHKRISLSKSTSILRSQYTTLVQSSFAAKAPTELPIKTVILDAQFTQLEPSPLPAASTYYAAESSSGDTSSISDASSFLNMSNLIPAHLRREISFSSIDAYRQPGDTKYDERDDEYTTSDDSVIDLLASERKTNPEFVAMRELAFKREQASLASQRSNSRIERR